jgi:tetratricopeptide (TPR) repeat protein
MVLIKLFKNEGALKGILGFFCGIYTFIWGWLKHKELALTKIMTVWSIFTVASMVVPGILISNGAYELMSYANTQKGDVKIKMANQNAPQKSLKAIMARKSKKIQVTTLKKKGLKKAAIQNVDWSQKAMAAKAYNNRGLAYHDLKLYQQAIKDYSRAIELDSVDVAAYNNRGNSYYELTEYQLALTDFNKSLQLKPDYPKAYINRGLVYYQLDSHQQACNDFQNACDQGQCQGLSWAMKNAICK